MTVFNLKKNFFITDVQCRIFHYGFILQVLQKDTAVQGCITKLLKEIALLNGTTISL